MTIYNISTALDLKSVLNELLNEGKIVGLKVVFVNGECYLRDYDSGETVQLTNLTF